MRQLFTPQESRAVALLPHFSANTARRIRAGTQASPAGWTCALNVPGELWFACYLGPTATEAWSFLVWRRAEVAGSVLNEAVAQYTEPEHQRKGYARAVLLDALSLAKPLMSDREGMTYAAFSIWYPLALRCGQVLNVETGVATDVNAYAVTGLWNCNEDCERLQLLFADA